ncbi:MAG: 50S ribosomal protein L23 [Victivallaceae bacterium]|nr:50S ribosomal protein L23 [Victivallaceae bacterium]
MNSFDIVIAPVVTEKVNALAAKGKYVFKVKCDAGKIEIAHAIEELFKVKVASVNVMNCLGKTKRVGRSPKEGRRPDWKKAIVTLSEGSIEIF